MKHRFASLAGEPLVLELPPATGTDTFFVLAPHKAGSVLLFNLVRDLATAAGRSVVDFPGQTFMQGVADADVPLAAWALCETPGHIYIGNRSSRILSSVRAYRTCQKILLVRNPCDIAVSYYFSVRDSHVIPTSGGASEVLKALREASSRLDIETFLQGRRADVIFENMRGFAGDIRRFPNFRVFRYEDVIFKKESFVTELAAQLQIDVSAAIIAEIANRHDVRPTEERTNEHIRQVTPGNHKVHLSAAACQRLELLFSDVFTAFGYPLSNKSEL